jgi:isopentenyl diphosphate isomerase/L-lactate dehydrogenase-like FMN-dependent dehydrogenase
VSVAAADALLRAEAPGGREGVEAVVENFRADLDLTVALAGATDVDGIDRSVLRERPEPA